MGTLAYMAPEQIDGGSVDERSDQCSWCIAAWEALTGASGGVLQGNAVITGNVFNSYHVWPSAAAAAWALLNGTGASLFDGDKHGADQLPIVLSGGAGGTLKRGRALDFLDKGTDKRRACSLYLSIMDQMGVKVDRFGDTDKRLPGLFS